MLGRLILVSNRLPVTVRRGREGVPALIRSNGGMVAALGPVHEAGNGIWLGNIGDRPDANVEASLEENGYVRVPVLSRENYLGYANPAVCFVCIPIVVERGRTPHLQIEFAAHSGHPPDNDMIGAFLSSSGNGHVVNNFGHAFVG